MKKGFLFLMHVCIPLLLQGQGKTHNLLTGYTTILDTNTTYSKGRFLFDNSSLSIVGETRKMPFGATQGNISDENGNLLMVSNGCWIADATGDTMMNGSGLNPSPFTSNYCDPYGGLPLIHGNVFLPFPNDNSKYVLFHQTGGTSSFSSPQLFYSIIDMNLNNGLGAVILKNQVIVTDNLSWGISVNKHANGRDWWIVVLRDFSTVIHKILLDTSGVTYIGTQNLGYSVPQFENATQCTFSPDGKKFAYSYGLSGSNPFHDVRLFDFDRCSGNFTPLQYITFNDSTFGFGFSFSSNSKYLYSIANNYIYQINTDTSNILASINTVAVYDGFYSPSFPYSTRFWYSYLAANGKIYVVPGSSVLDIHCINFPDSAGNACDVQQHSIHLPFYSYRANVNHPNYYLGCDTTSGCSCLITSMNELKQYDFKFSISPNPTSSNIKIMYLLPQNSKGVFEIYDVTGKKVFTNILPSWSTLQNFDLSFLDNGIYNCTIKSSNQRTTMRIAIIK